MKAMCARISCGDQESNPWEPAFMVFIIKMYFITLSFVVHPDGHYTT
jgi:hypothetical protein